MASNMRGGRFRTIVSVYRNSRCRRCDRPIPASLLGRHLGECKGESKRRKTK